MNKFICWLFGHDYEIRIVTYPWISPTESRRICKRCGKEDKKG